MSEEKGGRSQRVLKRERRFMAIEKEWMHESQRNRRGIRNKGQEKAVKEWEEERWRPMVIRNCGDAGELKQNKIMEVHLQCRQLFS